MKKYMLNPEVRLTKVQNIQSFILSFQINPVQRTAGQREQVIKQIHEEEEEKER